MGKTEDEKVSPGTGDAARRAGAPARKKQIKVSPSAEVALCNLILSLIVTKPSHNPCPKTPSAA